MRFHSLLVVVFQAAAFNVARADVAVLKSNLAKLAQDYKTLQHEVVVSDGSVTDIVGYQNVLETIDKDTNTTGSNAAGADVLAAADSQSVVNYIANTLEPVINSTLTAIVAVRAQLRSSNTLATMRNSLMQVKNDTRKLRPVLVAKSASASRSGMQANFDKIDADFAAAIFALGGDSTVLGVAAPTCTPTIEHGCGNGSSDPLVAALQKYKSSCDAMTRAPPGYAKANYIDVLDSDTRDASSSQTKDVQPGIDYINEFLNPSLKSAMTSVSANATRSSIAVMGFTSAVCRSIEQLKQDNGAFFAGLLAKTPTSHRQSLNKALAGTTKNINIAYRAYCAARELKRSTNDYAEVTADLNRLKSDYGRLSSAVKAYNGNINDAVAIQNAANAIDDDTKQLSTDLGNSPSFTSAQAQDFIKLFRTLEPKIRAVMNAFIAKKSDFAANGLSGSMCNSIKAFQRDNEDLCSSIKKKTPQPQQPSVTNTCNAISADIQKAINVYCGSNGPTPVMRKRSRTTFARDRAIAARDETTGNAMAIRQACTPEQCCTKGCGGGSGTGVIADLQKLKSDCEKLTRDAKAFPGGTSDAILLDNDLSAIENDFRRVSSDFQNSPAFTAAQWKEFETYFKAAEPSYRAALNALIAKRSKFVAAGLSSTMCSDLQVLQSDENALCQALLAKTPSTQEQSVQALCAKFAADLQQGINAFC